MPIQGPGLQPRIQTSGCPSLSGAVPPNQPLSADDYIELERTACFGTCPVYSVRIYADGKIVWHGNSYVNSRGAMTTQVGSRESRALIDKLKAAGFWGLCNSYSQMVSDFPTTLTRLHIGNAEKQVSNYANSAPTWLQDFEIAIDAFADTHRWIHGDPRLETVNGVELRADVRGAKPGRTRLMQMVATSSVADVQKELAGNANPNIPDSSGWTALFYATQSIDVEVVRILIKAGADVNARSHMRQTPIMAAAANFSRGQEMMETLIAAGANINAQDVNGQTALMFEVRRFTRPELVAFMLKAGARTDLRDSKGLTALDHLGLEARKRPTQRQEYETFRRLLEGGALWRPGRYHFRF